MGLFSWFISHCICHWHIENLLIDVCLFCTLSPFWKCQSFLGVSEFVKSWRSLTLNIIVPANRDTATPVYICILWIFAALAKISRTILSSNGGYHQFCLALAFNDIVTHLSPFSMVLAVDLSYIAFVALRYVLSNSILSRAFTVQRCGERVGWGCTESRRGRGNYNQDIIYKF